MSLISVNLATEDELSEVTLYRILGALGRYAVGTPYRRGGFGYLRRTVHGWNAAAKGMPFIVLTDLDTSECAPALIESWLRVPSHPNLLFRVAVREVEAWLLADASGIAEFLGLRKTLVPVNPDDLPDPKAALVRLAGKSRSKYIRESIVPRAGSTAKQGPDYNGCLAGFVKDRWSLDEARANSPSLARTYERLRTFTPVWE